MARAAHVTPGMRWASAMYDLRMDLESAPRAPPSTAPVEKAPPGKAGCAACTLSEEPPSFGIAGMTLAALLAIRFRRRLP